MELLEGFATRTTTAKNIEAVLGIPAEEFDERFDEYLQDRFGKVVEKLPEFRKAMKRALSAAKEKNWDAVLGPAAEAQDIYPDFIEAANPYVVLATAYNELGDKAAAVDQLKQYQDRGGKNPRQIKKAAKWLEELGRLPEAIDALEALVYITPGDPEVHVQLGEWLLETDRYPEALREFHTHLASNPLDQAGAHFNLARAYHKMEDSENTKKHLLSALEAAPSYRPAQKLLLEIVD